MRTNPEKEAKDQIMWRIEACVGIIAENKVTGWSKELNLVSWNGKDPRYDIREWSPEHDKMSRGVTLSPFEMKAMVDMYLQTANDRVMKDARAKEQARRAQKRKEWAERKAAQAAEEATEAEAAEVPEAPAVETLFDQDGVLVEEKSEVALSALEATAEALPF